MDAMIIGSMPTATVLWRSSPSRSRVRTPFAAVYVVRSSAERSPVAVGGLTMGKTTPTSEGVAEAVGLQTRLLRASAVVEVPTVTVAPMP